MCVRLSTYVCVYVCVCLCASVFVFSFVSVCFWFGVCVCMQTIPYVYYRIVLAYRFYILQGAAITQW